MIFVFSWLAYCTWHNVFQVHLCGCVCLFFFSTLNNIPLSVYITFCLSVHPLMNTWFASIFWFLWKMSLLSQMNKYFFESLHSVRFWYICRCRISRSYVILFLIFSIIFSNNHTVLHSLNHFIFLPTVYKVSNFSVSSPTLVIFCCVFFIVPILMDGK